MTNYTPNSGIDSMPYLLNGANAERPQPVPVGAGWCNMSARSRHPGGVQTVFGDGSVHFASDSIAATVWQDLSSMSGDEVIPGDAF